MSTPKDRSGALVGGSILVAALSSACCWLPLLAMALGFSVAGLGSVFERYRFVLLALAAGFFVGAVLLQRQAQRACETACCPPPRRSRLLLPVVGGLGALGFALFPEALAWRRADEATNTRRAAESGVLSYQVTGMTCESCTGLLTSYLEEQPEIEGASVDYGSATARIRFTPSTTDTEAVMRRIAEDWDTYTFEPVAVGEAN